MKIPMLGPSEVNLDACGLVPASVRIDRGTVFGLDYLFQEIGKTDGLRNGVSIIGSMVSPVEVDGSRYDDSQVIYMKDDCAILDYNRRLGGGLLNILVVRQDILEIVRPIPMVPKAPVPASINGFSVVEKYRAVDDVLRATRNIVDPC